MGNEKKTNIVLRIILLLILFIPTYFAIYNIWVISSDNFTVENTTKIQITDKDDRLLAEYTHSADIKTYIRMLDSAAEVGASVRELAYEQPLILKFFKGDKQFIYGMYLSLNPNDCLIMTSEKKLLLMNENDAKRILNTTLADILYEHNNIPVANLYRGEETVKIYPSEGEWNLRKANGQFDPSTIPNEIMKSNKAKAFQSKPFDLYFNIEPDILNVEVIVDKEIKFNGAYSVFVENFRYDEMKDMQYIVTAAWNENENNNYYGNATYVLDVRYYVPAKFDISQTEAEPGEIVVITAYNMSEDENLILTTDIGYETKFVSVGTNRVALIPISSDFAGKTFNMTLTSDVNDPIEYYLKINEKAAQSKNVSAQDANVDKHLSESAKSQKQSIYDVIFGVSSGNNEKYWTDRFAMPKEGAIVLNYGQTITVNAGNPHINNGINIETPKGDPVRASNGGKVIFTGEVPYEGNMIVIDHGMGIKTWYGHLGEIEVKVDDAVIKGQQIGTYGATGLPTSASLSLSFAVSVNNVFVNPVALIENGIPGVDSASRGVSMVEPVSAEDSGEFDIPEAAAEDIVENAESADA